MHLHKRDLYNSSINELLCEWNEGEEGNIIGHDKLFFNLSGKLVLKVVNSSNVTSTYILNSVIILLRLELLEM